jgi:NAD+-dependent protein deacetylase SIR2
MSHRVFKYRTRDSIKNKQKFALFCRTLRPTAFHHALQAIAKQGRLQRVYTQNVDGLEEVAGLSVFPTTCMSSIEAQVIALHGSVHYLVAKGVKCNHQHYRRGGDEVTDVALNRGEEPRCPECEHRPGRHSRVAKIGTLSHAILHFGETASITDQIKDTTDLDKYQADLLVIVGTAMTIEGLRNMVLELLSSSNPPKCLFVDLRKIAPSSLPAALCAHATLLTLDCQLLAERILQDITINSEGFVCCYFPRVRDIY